MTIGVERFRLRVKDLEEELDVNYDTASLRGRGGTKRRADDRTFAQGIEALVEACGPADQRRTDEDPRKPEAGTVTSFTFFFMVFSCADAS